MSANKYACLLWIHFFLEKNKNALNKLRCIRWHNGAFWATHRQANAKMVRMVQHYEFTPQQLLKKNGQKSTPQNSHEVPKKSVTSPSTKKANEKSKSHKIRLTPHKIMIHHIDIVDIF